MAKAAKKRKPVKKTPAKKKAATRKLKEKAIAKGQAIAPPSEQPKPTGRPEIYTPDIADKLCEEISTSSKSLKTICAMDGMPSVRTVLRWLREDKGGEEDKSKGFCVQYARAKEEQADFLTEEMIDIADDGSNDFMTITKGDISYEVENKEWTSRSKLRVETRKWAASKLKPKKYGDKLDIGMRGKDGNLVDPPPAVNITVAPIEIPIAEKEE